METQLPAEVELQATGRGNREIKETPLASSSQEIQQALVSATTAYETYKNTSGLERAGFLRAIAAEIGNLGDVLCHTVMEETALAEGRVKNEMGRTTAQLESFAQLLEEGSWVEANINVGETSASVPDIRRILVPLGPVVVFAASNFPLAFSTAGGDTAAALAAGNPVIVKAHSAHLRTNELITKAILRAAEKMRMPAGVFYSLNGGIDLGLTLVRHPAIKAVGFTGSFQAGMNLYREAALREDPIPVFAEMGSINPVILLSDRLKKEGPQLAKQLAGSILLGAGQFCTNPGLMLSLESDEFNAFIQQLCKEVAAVAPSTMLNEGIWKGYNKKREEMKNHPGVVIDFFSTNDTKGKWNGLPGIASVSAEVFLSSVELQEEVFGPFSMLVKCKDKPELIKVLRFLKGQLTATLMASEDDLLHNADIAQLIQNIAGRVIINDVPTGVQVCHAMNHGGPFPASTDSRFTSVGVDSIKRFVRPVCFQNYPQQLLPPELRNENPLKILRKVNGNFTRNPL